MKMLCFTEIKGEAVWINPAHIIAVFRSPEYPTNDRCVLVLMSGVNNGAVTLRQPTDDVISALEHA